MPFAAEVGTESTSGLTFSAKTIDLGYVPPGGRAEEIVVLTNEGTTPQKLAKIDTSCECLRAKHTAGEISPAGRVTVLITFDLSKDEDYVGTLLMDIVAIDTEGRQIASAEVATTVDQIAKSPK